MEKYRENQVINNVHQLIRSQQEKGYKKYGTLVNTDDYSLTGWIEHAQQEVVDMLIYLECIKQKVKESHTFNYDGMDVDE